MSGHIFLPASASVAVASARNGVEVAAATSTGGRRTNADAYLIDEAAGFFAVSDAMGDTPRSGVVARMALDAVRELFLAPWADLPLEQRWPAEAGERLRIGVTQANGRLYVENRAEPLGTTFAGAVVCSQYLCVASVGDSRVYLFRPRTGRIAKLTRDDTVLDEAVARGAPFDVAAASPNAHALTRAIGTKPALDLWPLALRWAPGDVLLLCTDGLTDFVGDGELSSLVSRSSDLGAAAARLVERAGRAGGWDNATVVLVQRAI
ncbi:MAG: protein phosphatase 2C domain-containing protein [Minicystis sp.]